MRCVPPRLIALGLPLLAACLPPTYPPQTDPLVVITFDDAHHSIYEIAGPLMRSYDPSWGATHFFPVCYPGQPGLMTLAQVQEMESSGWETGGHGRTHENLSAVTIEQVRSDVAASDSFLRANGLSHESYAYAFGNYNDSVQAVVAQHFRNIRTSHDFKYLDGVNRLQLGAYDGKAGHTAEDLIGRIEEARLDGSPLVIFCFHVIVPDTAVPDVTHGWWTSQSAFTGLLDYLHERGMAAMTVKAAMAELCE
jgi:peptidoglycan/xylan/chitin deacetylase (PgdA/CDA1 family)